jgi:hypothetical protein
MRLCARTNTRQLSWQTTFNSIGRVARAGTIVVATLLSVAQFSTPFAFGEPVTQIAIDGSFSDWASVPTYTDAPIGQFHTGTNIPDVHTTGPWDPAIPGDLPSATNHPDVDILEFKFTHDESNLYAYFKATGFIGRTIQRPPGATSGPRGRFYVIVTIDVDNNDDTGYWLHEGGYAPTSRGYDMNMELEFYDGSWNTGHYLSHDALTGDELNQDTLDLTNDEYDGLSDGPYTPGFVQPGAGNYGNYTQWVYHNNDTLTLVSDGGPVVPGIMTMALSPDGHEIEFRAPFIGFLNNESGEPNMALGKTIDVSFSLEASGQLVPGGTFGSDTADPIVGYYLGGVVPEPSTFTLVIAVLAVIAAHRRRQTSNEA